METFPSEFADTPKGSVQCSQVNAEKAKVLTERINAAIPCILKQSCWMSLVASPGAATSHAKEAIPRRAGLGVKIEASAQAIDCLAEESGKQRWNVRAK